MEALLHLHAEDPDLRWGAATRSADGTREYLPVLKAPQSGTRSLPRTLTGTRSSRATLLTSGHEPVIVQNG